MGNLKTAIFIALFFTSLTKYSYAQTVYVNSSHWIYQFLERMETKRLLDFPLLNTKPFTRTEIVSHLVSLENKYEFLDRVEREQLEFLRFEFREEFQRLGQSSDYDSRWNKLVRQNRIDPWLPDQLYLNGRNLFSYSSGPLKLYWDPVIARNRLYADADTLADSERVFEDTNGFVLWGSIGNHLGFYTDVRDTKEWGTRDYLHSRNTSRDGWGFVQEGDDHLYHDETVAYLVYSWKYFNVQFGKDKNKWGPGYRGQLALSDQATSYDQIKFQFNSKRIKFTSLVGILKHYNPDFFYGNPQEKMMAAHRLEFAPFNSLAIGLYETILYADRKFEPGYINPVMFYRSAEHYLGDRDNATMGIDAVLRVIPKTKIYADFFIDDMQTKKLGSGFYGNKYAWQVGGYHVDLFGLPQLDARLEYTRVRPYMYSHKFDLTGYRHFTTNLGHWVGPNADDFFAELAWRYSRRMLAKLQYEEIRHGANSEETNVGGSIYQPHVYPDDPQIVELLDGVREETKMFGFLFQYEVIRNGFVKLAFYKYHGESGWDDLGDKYPGDRTEAVISLSVNY
jgi:hypothetical protein